MKVTANVLKEIVEEDNKTKGIPYLVKASGTFNSGMYIINNVKNCFRERKTFDDVYYVELFTSTAAEVARSLQATNMKIDNIRVTSPKTLVITNSNSFDTIQISRVK